MTIPSSVCEQDLFCLNYLLNHGWFLDNKDEVERITKNLSSDFTIVRLEHSFFTELAEKLRALWPPGEKDGKYPWRDSVQNITKRLETLWTLRNLNGVTIDQCLTAARKYLANYNDNTKYMRILKYFILKQSTITESNGRRRLVNESMFADMLESLGDQQAFPEELDFEPCFQEELI
jgi:hypothetical protein